MTTTLTQLVGRIFGRVTKRNEKAELRAIAVEQLEGRTMMSGDLNPAYAADVPQPLIGLLLPAVQAAREAARRATISDGTSNTIMIAEAYKLPAVQRFELTIDGHS